MLTYILFIIGFVALIKGADFLVTGASSLAIRYGISSLAIGLTIVAFGTSAPELIVNLLASYNGNTEIAIGNILGSNIANILLILGISAMIYPLTVGSGTVRKEIPFALLAVIVVAFMANDALLDGSNVSMITRIDGLLLISFFIIFMYYIFGIAKQGNSSDGDQPIQYSYLKSAILILAGLVGLVVGGKWIVDGAVSFASGLGISEALVGLTIVAIGTSLPELATSVVATYRRNVDIAVGNIVGSNIFNIFWILGISATVSPLPFASEQQTDLLVALLTTVLLLAILIFGKRHVVERWHGVIFVLIYAIYITYLVFRG